METAAERHRRYRLRPAQVWVPEGVCIVLPQGVIESGTAAGVEPDDDVDLDLEMAAFTVSAARRSPEPPDRFDAGQLWVAVVGTLTRPADEAPFLDVGGWCVPVVGLITALALPDADRVEAVGLLRARHARACPAGPVPAEPWRVEGVEEVAITAMDENGRLEGHVRQLPRVPVAEEAKQRCLYALRLEAPVLDST